MFSRLGARVPINRSIDLSLSHGHRGRRGLGGDDCGEEAADDAGLDVLVESAAELPDLDNGVVRDVHRGLNHELSGCHCGLSLLALQHRLGDLRGIGQVREVEGDDDGPSLNDLLLERLPELGGNPTRVPQEARLALRGLVGVLCGHLLEYRLGLQLHEGRRAFFAQLARPRVGDVGDRLLRAGRMVRGHPGDQNRVALQVENLHLVAVERVLLHADDRGLLKEANASAAGRLHSACVPPAEEQRGLVVVGDYDALAKPAATKRIRVALQA
mmetsp:Transcript_124843/g.364622  ORF Transcript_124843/g.364622 Transcript_124843/m.364622 type:complete len:271 (-) Transcript_124843:216-1028(-)